MPSLPDVVDMGRLKRDIPKFLDNSRIITDAQKSWWEDFFSNCDTTYGMGPEMSPTWLLDEVAMVKKRCNASKGDARAQGNGEQSEQTPAELTGQLSASPDINVAMHSCEKHGSQAA